MVETENDQENRLDSKVIPVMREAVATVQLALYGQLKEKLALQYSQLRQEEFLKFVGCIVNDLFGTPAQDEDTVQFARKHFDSIEKELWGLAEIIPDLLPVLTDALRMQTLCDHEEGANSLPTLLRARALKVLQEERALPMPSTFMLTVRQLGAKYGLLEPMKMKDQPSE